MDPVTQHLISSYLLMPVLTVIFGIAAYFIARKNKLLNNKKLIVYLLLCGIVLALPGLSGFMDYNFMPYIYVLLAILYWTAGYYNRFLLRKVFASGKETPSFGIRCLLTVTVVLLGAGLFSVVFNLCNELQYGIWASTVSGASWWMRKFSARWTIPPRSVVPARRPKMSFSGIGSSA